MCNAALQKKHGIRATVGVDFLQNQHLRELGERIFELASLIASPVPESVAGLSSIGLSTLSDSFDSSTGGDERSVLDGLEGGWESEMIPLGCGGNDGCFDRRLGE